MMAPIHLPTDAGDDWLRDETWHETNETRIPLGGLTFDKSHTLQVNEQDLRYNTIEKIRQDKMKTI